MMNFVSMTIAIAALAQLWRPFLPFTAWASWMVIPLAMMGLGIGGLSEKSLGRDLNILVLAIASILLLLR